MEIDKFQILFGYLIFSIGTFVVWFSKKNFVASIQLGFFFIAYLLPILLTDTLSRFNPVYVHSFAQMMLIGGLTYLVGLIVGWRLKPFRHKTFTFEKILKFDSGKDPVERKIKLLFAITLIGIPIAFLFAGFVPAFANDPLAAKFLRNQYALNPLVDLIYRSMFLISTVIIIPITLYVIQRRTPGNIIMFAVLIVYISLFLQRGYIGIGVLTVLSIVMSSSTSRFALFVILNIFLFGLGSDLYQLLFNLGILNTNISASVSSLTQDIAQGAPDVSDQLKLFTNFVQYNIPYTNGLLFFGGLVPGHFAWNPSVWSLTFLNSEGTNDIISGGIRFTPALMGYVSFGIPGVIFVCILSGLLQGYFSRWLKNCINICTSKRQMLYYYLFFFFVLQPFSVFYSLSEIALPSIVITIYLLYKVSFRLRRPAENTIVNFNA
jgi:hypothetical protein